MRACFDGDSSALGGQIGLASCRSAWTGGERHRIGHRTAWTTLCSPLGHFSHRLPNCPCRQMGTWTSWRMLHSYMQRIWDWNGQHGKQWNPKIQVDIETIHQFERAIQKGRIQVGRQKDGIQGSQRFMVRVGYDLRWYLQRCFTVHSSLGLEKGELGGVH
jgi:hypothetical protein